MITNQEKNKEVFVESNNVKQNNEVEELLTDYEMIEIKGGNTPPSQSGSCRRCTNSCVRHAS